MRLTKYYFDGVSEDGDVFICYSATLSIGFVKIPYSSVIYHRKNRTIERSSFTRDVVIKDTEKIQWISEKLNAKGSWALGGDAFLCELYKDKNDHFIRWQLLNASSTANVTFEKKRYHLNGYVEKIELSMPLLKLPVKRLLWGRWISSTSDRYIVWIIWEDENDNTSLNKLWSNEKVYSASEYSLDRITFDNKTLTITKMGDIRVEDVNKSVIKSRLLNKMLPSSFKNIVERKYYGKGVIEDDVGSVIYEEVIWK